MTLFLGLWYRAEIPCVLCVRGPKTSRITLEGEMKSWSPQVQDICCLLQGKGPGLKSLSTGNEVVTWNAIRRAPKSLLSAPISLQSSLTLPISQTIAGGGSHHHVMQAPRLRLRGGLQKALLPANFLTALTLSPLHVQILYTIPLNRQNVKSQEQECDSNVST